MRAVLLGGSTAALWVDMLDDSRVGKSAVMRVEKLALQMGAWKVGMSVVEKVETWAILMAVSSVVK